MQRSTFANGNTRLSYIDHGGTGEPLIALHAYWMEAGTWDGMASALSPDYRVLALDQRGHGQSDKAADLSWDAFISDLGAFLDHLDAHEPVALVGNSLGGTVAFRYAARHPERVSVLVNEESPAVEDGNLDFMKAWDGVFPTRAALEEAIGERLLWSVEPSIRSVDNGWTLAFSARQLADNQQNLNGDFWSDWLATEHPALVIRGERSRAVDGQLLQQMADRRPGTMLQSFDAGHVVHHDQPKAFADAVRSFLNSHRD